MIRRAAEARTGHIPPITGQTRAAFMVDSKKIAFSLMFIGLDNAGKTLLLKQLGPKNKSIEIVPTANLEIHYVHIKDINAPILCYDLSGQGRHRENWRTFYEVVDGIGFVIDSEDEVRLKYAKKAIEMMITDEIVKKKQLPIFFFLNKSDKKFALQFEEINEVLQLTKYE